LTALAIYCQKSIKTEYGFVKTRRLMHKGSGQFGVRMPYTREIFADAIQAGKRRSQARVDGAPGITRANCLSVKHRTKEIDFAKGTRR